MRNVSLSGILLYLLFIFCCAAQKELDDAEGRKEVQLPSIEVKAEADRTTATIADTITFTLTVLYSPDTKVRLPEAGSKIAGLRIVDFGEDGPRQIDNRTVHKKWYVLQADIAGVYIVPALAVAYTDRGEPEKEIKTPQIFLEIKSTLIDKEGEQAKDIIGIKPLQEISRDRTLFVVIGITVLVAVCGIVGAFLYMRKKRHKKVEVRKAAHVLAFEELEKLRKENLIEKGGVREHYFRLSDIFRRYVENRFNIPAVERTTQELLPEIVKLEEPAASVKSSVAEFLFHSDMVKFAKYDPPRDEVENNHQKVKTVINETKKAESLSGQ